MMQKFYKQALLALIGLVIANALLAFFLIYQSYLTVSIVAADGPGAGWQYVTNTDQTMGGTSSARIPDPQRRQLRFDFNLSSAGQFPFAQAGMILRDAKGEVARADWTRYSEISFLAKCAPSNSMALWISTFDDNVSKVNDFMTYRTPGTYFSCNERGVAVSLDLSRFAIPDWWLYSVKLDLSHNGYELNKVSRLLFGTSGQSPANVDSYLDISELTLHGRDYRYIAALVIILPVSWLAFAFWFVRAHAQALTSSLNSKMKADLPLMAYRELTLEPHRDKEKATVLRYIATNYTNADLDLDSVVSATGTNRNKVNEILKTELGMTFTSYLNKLRLTQAARLLAEKGSATISEIAYSVGYSNVSYFNKLFKEEYGCTPKDFRTLASQQKQESGTAPPESHAPQGAQ